MAAIAARPSARVRRPSRGPAIAAAPNQGAEPPGGGGDLATTADVGAVAAFPADVRRLQHRRPRPSAGAARLQGLHPFGPNDSFIDYLFVGTLTQGVLFGSLSGGSELAQDIESGFFDRLISTPVSAVSILSVASPASAALGFVQALVFMAVFIAFGARIEGGMAGAVVIPVAAAMLSSGHRWFRLRHGHPTGSVEAVQGVFPLLFISLFVSSAFFPTALMKGWYKTVATHNPLTVDDRRHALPGARRLRRRWEAARAI